MKKIIIIGSGFGGLSIAVRLLQTNCTDFIILNREKEIGSSLGVDVSPYVISTTLT